MAATTAKTGVATTIGAVIGTLVSVVAIGDRFYAPVSVVAAQANLIAVQDAKIQALERRLEAMATEDARISARIDLMHSGDRK